MTEGNMTGGGMDGRIVTVRMKGYPATEVLIAAMEDVKAWSWTGNAPVPVRLEYALWTGGKVMHFAFGEVMWAQADADALAGTVNAIDAIACDVPVDPAARKAAKYRAAKGKEGARPKPDPATLVKPSLRHLLGEAGREEGRRLLDRLKSLPGGSLGLVALADALAEEFPLMAQADAALDGTIRGMLWQAGRLTGPTDAFDEMPWRAVAKAVADGNVEFLTPRFVGGMKNPGLVERALVALAVLRWRHDGMPPVTERLTVLCA